MIPLNWLQEAMERIAPFIRQTPLTYDEDNAIYLKWENQQVTGSFKARGAFNKVLSLLDWEREQGLVTASAGNHGQGVALAGQRTGARVIVFASEHAVPKKIAAMRALGAEVRLTPGGYGDAEAAGLEYARQSGSVWISPYNDGQVIAGQGTIGLEVGRALANLAPDYAKIAWVVPVGGGGLISGIGASLQAQGLSPDQASLIAVQSQASPFMHALYHQGSQEGVEELPSLADGLSGPVEANSLTIPMLKNYVDEFMLVSEEDIGNAVAYCWQRYQERIEGSAAAALAAVLSGKLLHRPAVIIISGGNIEDEVFKEVVEKTSG